jgi:HTH-type transcriptional regulator / antitoxin HipB
MAFVVTAPEQLGPTLNGLRKARKLTQMDVAKASGLRQKTVSLIETAPHRCSVDSLMRYLAAVHAAMCLDPIPQTSDKRAADTW